MAGREALWKFLRATGLVVTMLVVGVPFLLLVVALPIATWHTWGAAIPLSLATIGLIWLIAEDM